MATAGIALFALGAPKPPRPHGQCCVKVGFRLMRRQWKNKSAHAHLACFRALRGAAGARLLSPRGRPAPAAGVHAVQTLCKRRSSGQPRAPRKKVPAQTRLGQIARKCAPTSSAAASPITLLAQRTSEDKT